jgi:nucleotide-binding universal stress UspA family protein
MKTKCLVTVDNSEDALKAVNYVAKELDHSATITLLSVLPDPTPACRLDGPSLIPLFKQNIRTFCATEGAKKSAMEGFMEEAKKTLVKAGFPSENVSIRVRKKKADIARDIVKEAMRGRYDTLVMGRRKLSGVNKFLSSSVSDKVLEAGESPSKSQTNGRNSLTTSKNLPSLSGAGGDFESQRTYTEP